MLIDCDRCEVRGTACGGCVVTVLLGGPPDEVSIPADEVVLDAASRAAIEVLADSGLIPPLRLVLSAESTVTGEGSPWHEEWDGRSAAG